MLGAEVKENAVTTNGLQKGIGFVSGVMQMLYHDCGGSYMTVYILQNASFKTGEFYFISVIP